MAMAAISMTELSVSFLCGLRGYHIVYKNESKPILNETLPAIHEAENVYDCYVIAAWKKLPRQTVESTLGHLPKEISLITRYIVLYGAVVRIRVTDVNHQRSPLVQEGLEITVEVLVKMPVDAKNEEAMKRYEVLVSQNYKKPVNGSFEDITDFILQ